jgi:hypothetical protein
MTGPYRAVLDTDTFDEIDDAWVPTALVHSPLLTDAGRWSHDPTRHLIREALWADRDKIFDDLFRKLRDREPRGRPLFIIGQTGAQSLIRSLQPD